MNHSIALESNDVTDKISTESSLISESSELSDSSGNHQSPELSDSSQNTEASASSENAEMISLEEARRLIDEAYLKGRNEQIEERFEILSDHADDSSDSHDDDEVAALFNVRPSVWK